MNQPHKVIWSEGLLLTPQHFQQAEQYQDMVFRERFSSLSPYGWGFTELDIDPDALQNGTFLIRRCRAVMPDGLSIRAPEHDPLPPARSMEALFTPSTTQIDVWCGIPVEQLDGINCRLEQNNGSAAPTRYVADTAKVHDQTTGDVRELVVARKNFKIFFSQEDTGGYTTMKVAELVRGQGGILALRDTYIPPCLCINGSPALMQLLRGLIEILAAKRNSLAAQYRGADLAVSDIAKFFLFHLLNTTLPVLCHFYESAKVHPETLYMALAKLAGGLSTVSPSIDPTQLPPYQHHDLRSMFGALEAKIRTAVEGMTVIRYQAIPLSKSRESVWEGPISDDHLLQTAQFYFVASTESPDDTLQEIVPRRIKVSAAKDVDVIVATALPGLRLTYVSTPPQSLPVRSGSRYFRVEKQGDFWESVCRSHVIAFYVPAELNKLRLELLAIK